MIKKATKPKKLKKATKAKKKSVKVKAAVKTKKTRKTAKKPSKTTKAKKASKTKVASKTKKPRKLSKKPAKKKAVPDLPPAAKVYMSVSQRKWFRKKLESMLNTIQLEVERTAKDLREQEKGFADEFDRAHSENAFASELRENTRIHNLEIKINHALRQIENGTYGICDDCGVEIGLQRMIARPVATKCIDCKEFQEELEKNTH